MGLTTRSTYNNTKDYGRYSAPYETLPCLLWGQFDQRSFAEEEAKHVGHDVITDDHGHWNQQPDNTQAVPVSRVTGTQGRKHD